MLHAPGDEKNLMLFPLHEVGGGELHTTLVHGSEDEEPPPPVALDEVPVEPEPVDGAVSCPAHEGSQDAQSFPLHVCWQVAVKPSGHVFELAPQALDSHGLHCPREQPNRQVEVEEE